MVKALDLTVETEGVHYVNENQTYVVVSLHEGFADLLAMQNLPLNMVYPAAEELFDWDHLGPYLHASQQPSLSRTSGPSAYRTLLRAGEAASGRGESLAVFPQGSILGIETAFTGGAFRTAEHLGVPVLPVVITGSAGVWDYPFGKELHFGSTVRMEVLPPIAANLAVSSANDLEYEMKERALQATPKPRHYIPARDGWWDDYRFEIDDRFPDLANAVEDHRAGVEKQTTVG
jgi:1-acyl-sn-glycerol-3-phosphate acyltransferase